MEGWMIWAKKCGDKLVEMGAPLMGGQTFTRDGKSQDSNNAVNGYSILQAETMEEAKALLQGNIKLIKTEEDYQIALKRLEVIFDAKSGTIESDEADILGLMIDEYEKNIIQ